jgi:osmotically-inducible protein OsmY
MKGQISARGREACRFRRFLGRGLALVALVAVLGGCATGDPWKDARIENEVKARLVAEKDANLTRLGVVSRQAVVHLSGTVASPDQKATAESLAKSVAGVRRVVNALEVRPAPPGPTPPS